MRTDETRCFLVQNQKYLYRTEKAGGAGLQQRSSIFDVNRYRGIRRLFAEWEWDADEDDLGLWILNIPQPGYYWGSQAKWKDYHKLCLIKRTGRINFQFCNNRLLLFGGKPERNCRFLNNKTGAFCNSPVLLPKYPQYVTAEANQAFHSRN